MNRFVSSLLALGMLLNGLWMILSPGFWYASIPGVPDTGPFNPHFVRDIGCSFLVAGLGFAWLGLGSRKNAWPAASAGALFLSLHAVIHIWDLLCGREHPQRVTDDLPSIFLPAVLAWLLIAVTGRPPRKRRVMTSSSGSDSERTPPHGIFARVIGRNLSAFRRELDYDTSYLEYVAQTSPSAFMRFAMFTVFAGQNENVPNDAWFTAKLCAAKREDCGPCAQLVVRMAERATPPVPPETLRGVIENDETRMSPDARLAFQFANAVLDRDLLRADELRAQVIRKWGERGMVTLAMTIASSRVYPTMKYGLGYGRECSKLTVGDALVVANAGV